MEDKYLEWFGDHEAAGFASELWTAAQEWDDLEDEGKCNHNALLQWLAFGKEYQPFFRRHQEFLRPAMMQMLLDWSAANVLDHEPEHVAKAYVLRAGFYRVLHLMVWICRGYDDAVRVGPDIWRHYGETLDELKAEMTCPDQH